MNIQFYLAVAGMALIITKSKLFKPIRMYVSSQHLAKENSKFWWFLSSITDCPMCFSIWGGLILYLISLFISIEPIELIFGGAIVTTLIIDLRDYICRK